MGADHDDRLSGRDGGANCELDPFLGNAGSTRVTLRDADQDRLHYFLEELHAKNLRLLSVTQGQPDLEEIFLRLIHAGAADKESVA